MKSIQLIIVLTCCTLTSACGYLVEKQLDKFSQQLSSTVLNFEDPATVSSAMPTFLILIDTMANPDDASANLKLSAAQLYGAYSGAFVQDNQRQKVLSHKAFDYAQTGSCMKDEKWCSLSDLDNEQFPGFVEQLVETDVELAYAYAVAWLGYIQAHGDNWNVVANLSRAKQLLEFVVEQDESHDNAGAHLYLGAIATTLPPAMGGKPEIGKAHFERAIELTDGKHFLVKVEYARRYARLLFDEELHHRLVMEVLEGDPEEEGLTLMNTYAQQEAKKLLDTEKEYFE